MTDVVRVRASRRFLLWFLPVFFSLGVLTLQAWLPGSQAEPRAPFRVTWVVLVVLTAVMFGAAVLRPPGIDLREHDAVVVHPWFSRVVPWRDVQAVVAARGGVVLYRSTGRPVRCPYPRSRYDADFHRVGQWWLAHRGADWRPVAPFVLE